MPLLDQVKQALKGRSGAIEKGIDTVVGQLGKYGETLKAQAEGLKARVRALDEDAGSPGTSPTTVAPQPLRGDLATPAASGTPATETGRSSRRPPPTV